MTGYQIQGQDRRNAFTDDGKQVFATLEDAREWADEIWEQIQECEKDSFLEDDERTKKDDMIVAYYENGVQRGEYPLFIG